jgi:integrase
LKDTYKRRDRKSPFSFPAKLNPLKPTKTFKQTWINVRKKVGVFGTEKDIGFHHMRHYFISHCVMAGIDFMTIVIWVNHRDGGAMIGRIYGRLKPAHSANQLIRPVVPAFPVGGKIYRRKQLGGLLNYYFRDAAT